MATLTFAQTRWWAARFRLRPVLAGDARCSQSLQSAYLTALSKVRPLRGKWSFSMRVWRTIAATSTMRNRARASGRTIRHGDGCLQTDPIRTLDR